MSATGRLRGHSSASEIAAHGFEITTVLYLDAATGPSASAAKDLEGGSGRQGDCEPPETALRHDLLMRNLLSQGELLVVETKRGRYLGTVEVKDATFVIRSGHAGRPVVVPVGDVSSVLPPPHDDQA